jgi:hypothetical protein
MTWLKQSTAVTVPVGPFVDSTDGVTAETALTISQADIRLSKNGAAYAQTNNATGASHMENGWYGVPLDTTDTNTLGSLVVAVNESGACPAWRNFMVVPANVWDSMFGADKLQVHADEITAGLITAAAIATDAIDADAIAANAVTEIQSGLATASALATVDGVVDGIKAVTDLLPDAGALTSLATAAALATVDGIVDDILVDTGTTLPATLSTIAGYLDTEIAAIKAKTDNLPSDPADQSAVEAAILAAWTTALTESYAADGVAPTPAQILFLISQHLSESSISGTTKTVKKLDGSTTAATFTLNDATAPTAITRAT